ncbi:hypothetical protein [Burkholderia ubonensis]|uniref:hypothetical protein n=1 Tax=Burkholderia ubonensis TaxID=101571 RepID=UPI0012F96031|nr:hypothetical protein [Burkholderia ubonensis]
MTSALATDSVVACVCVFMKKENQVLRMRGKMNWIGVCAIILGVALSGVSRATEVGGRCGDNVCELRDIQIVSPANEDIPAEIRNRLNEKVRLDIPNRRHVVYLTADLVTKANKKYYKDFIEKSLASKGTVILRGERDALLDLKPGWIRIWPDADTLILTSRFGTRIDGIRNRGRVGWHELLDILSKHIANARRTEEEIERSVKMSSPIRVRRSANLDASLPRAVDFSIRPQSPTEACQAFGNSLVRNIIGRPIGEGELRSLSMELNRWCQSGTLSHYQATTAGHPVPNWPYTDKVKLNLVTEWAFIRSEDVLVPRNSKYYLWVKTIGQGAGVGFTRNLEDTATFSDYVMRGLVDAAIHTGWGGVTPNVPGSWTYPAGIEHWVNRDPPLFGCNSSMGGAGCPAKVSVSRLYPSDTFNNSVNVSSGITLAVGGTVEMGTPSSSVDVINAQLIVKNMESVTRSAIFNMANVQTSSAQPFSRSTRWRPDVAAIWDYLRVRNITGMFGNATPSASTINPEYDVIWQMPISDNINNVMKFSIVYEAGWNSCVKYFCAGTQIPPDRSISPQGRVYWLDSIVVDLSS